MSEVLEPRDHPSLEKYAGGPTRLYSADGVLWRVPAKRDRDEAVPIPVEDLVQASAEGISVDEGDRRPVWETTAWAETGAVFTRSPHHFGHAHTFDGATREPTGTATLSHQRSLQKLAEHWSQCRINTEADWRILKKCGHLRVGIKNLTPEKFVRPSAR